MCENSLSTEANNLKSTPEWVRINNIQNFELSLKIFRINAKDLSEFIEKSSAPKSVNKLLDIRTEVLFETYITNVCRLLHNYVSSAFALVDHARRLHSKQYKNMELFKDYEEQVSHSFAKDPLHCFIKDLRNYFIHIEIPTLSSKSLLNNGGKAIHKIVIKKEELLGFGWSNIARQFLDATESEIDIQEITNKYSANVEEFYKWFFQRLEEIHASDLELIHKQQDKAHKLFAQTFVTSIANDLRIFDQIETDPNLIFLSVLDTDCCESINKNISDPIERARAYIIEVEKYTPLNDELKARIIDAFMKFYNSKSDVG